MKAGLSSRNYLCQAYGTEAYAEQAGIMLLPGSLDQWVREFYPQSQALVFIGACGIAVRAIAPYIKSKTVDPAVVVVDERGKYAISLLSGHIGGANDLAREIAELIGADPVITTATDLNHKFAVDAWARGQELWLGDMALARAISARILNGELIGFASDYPIAGQVPRQLVNHADGADTTAGFLLSIYENKHPFAQTLHLVPRMVAVGIGCRKGTTLAAVEALLLQALREQGISVHAIEKVCSIDIKKEERALRQLAEKFGAAYEVFAAAELVQVEGEFTSSEFVKSVTGVDNVSERAAVLGSRGKLIVPKQVSPGVTLALAIKDRNFQWTAETGKMNEED